MSLLSKFFVVFLILCQHSIRDKHPLVFIKLSIETITLQDKLKFTCTGNLNLDRCSIVIVVKPPQYALLQN